VYDIWEKEEPQGIRLVLGIDQTSVTALDKMKWKPFSRLGQASSTLLNAKTEGKNNLTPHTPTVDEEVEEEANLMVVFSSIQVNLQHKIADSKVLTKTVSGKEIDIALTQEQWYRDNCIRGLDIQGYTMH
jgi:hypothetical protein